jgi:hypothetical protein
MSETLQQIIGRLWIAPENAEWTPKTDVVPLEDIREWMKSSDIEILGFTHSLIHNGRFRIDPPITPAEYTDFVRHYFERCLHENPDGEWSDSRYSAGMDLVNIFVSLWKDERVPRAIVDELKQWLGQLYKDGDDEIRTCIVHATLEHLLEQRPLRKFFSDWDKDPVLRVAYRQALEWYQGSGRSPLGKPPFVPR